MGHLRMRAFLIASVVMVVFAATCGSASAQVFWGDSGGRSGNRSGGWGWDDRRSGGWDWGDHHHHDFFFPFFGDHNNRQAPAVDYSKAPPPRKLDTPPSNTVVVIGDSLADWLLRFG
jgi:hypothetical protein